MLSFVESNDCSQQDYWKSLVDSFLLENRVYLAKYATATGAFNNCREASEFFVSNFKGKNSNLKIIQLEGYKGNLNRAHLKWRNFRPGCIVHYLVEIGGKYTLDLTAKQFDSANEAVVWGKTDSLINLWDEVEYC